MADGDKPNTDGDKSASSDAPVQVSQSFSTPRTETTTEAELNKIEKEMTGFERSTLRWAKVAVLMSALAAVFVCLQWIVMGDQLKEMRGSSDQMDRMIILNTGQMIANAKTAAEAVKQASATSDLAQQAKRQSDIAVENFHNEERAWVGVDKIILYMDGIIPKSTEVILKNSGKTPARCVETSVQVNVAKDAQLPQFEKSLPPFIYPIEGTQTVMVPGVAGTAGSINMKGIIFNPNDRLFIHGISRYDDIFGKHHWLTFCKYINHGETGLTECNTHNDTGDELKRDTVCKPPKPNVTFDKNMPK